MKNRCQVVTDFICVLLLTFTSTFLAGQTSFGQVDSQSRAGDPDDIYWDSTIATSGGGLNGAVTALTVYDSKLVVAGEFTTAGGITVNHIAAWDGSSWSPLGSGVNGGISALTVYDGKLVIGGAFDSAGGIGANHIAAWSGTSWEPFGDGLPGSVTEVTALCEYHGQLAAGYSVYAINPQWSNTKAEVSLWNGFSWTNIADIFSGGMYHVGGLCVFQERLYASIGVSQLDYAYGYLITWDGDVWASGPDYGGGRIREYNGKLLVQWGWWVDMQGESGLATWDGNNWTDLVTGISVGSFEEQFGGLVAAGLFSSVNGVAANNIAQFSYSAYWSPLGSGTNGEIAALTVYDGLLIVGGYFTTAGGKPSSYIAQWTKKPGFCGDSDANYFVNISDAVYLIMYILSGGPAPAPLTAGDSNCDGTVNVSDAVYLISYIFGGGPSPCAACK